MTPWCYNVTQFVCRCCLFRRAASPCFRSGWQSIRTPHKVNQVVAAAFGKLFIFMTGRTLHHTAAAWSCFRLRPESKYLTWLLWVSSLVPCSVRCLRCRSDLCAKTSRTQQQQSEHVLFVRRRDGSPSNPRRPPVWLPQWISPSTKCAIDRIWPQLI